MAHNSTSTGSRLSSLMIFLLVSALSGVLVAGLVVPLAVLAGTATKATAGAMENLPVELATPPQAETTSIFMADGSLLAKVYQDDRSYVALDKIAPIMRKAQITIEDKRFYEHGALDFKGTMRAILVSGGQQGGSSLTQQYVKQVQIENAKANGNNKQAIARAKERTITRKIQELRYAVAMESKFSKDQILERYLNIAYYGDGSYGVESAARHYFGHPASQLTLPESAMLAGIVKNPSALNPVTNERASLDRRNTVLAVMLQEKVITRAEYDAAVKTPFDQTKVSKRKRGCTSSQFPHLCNFALEELKRSGLFGGDPKERMETIERGGFNITLTVDPKDQKLAEEEIAKRVGPTDPAIGLMNVIDPQTGKILVMAQSRPQVGTGEGQTFFNYNAPLSMGGAEGYQPGSNFKLYTVAAAMKAGIPTSRRYDSPSPKQFKGTTFKSCDGPFVYNQDWSPKNDGGRAGNFDMIFATQHSVNTYFVQLERDAGICDAIKMAESSGVKITKGKLRGFHDKPAFTLGVAEVVPLTMATSYGTFANRGKRCEPTIISSIKTKAGKELNWPYPHCTQAIDQNVADATNKVMSTVMDRGGSGAPMNIPGYDLAGKTGTTNEAQAMWFSGYAPNLAGSAAIVMDKTHPYWKTHRKRLEIRLSTGVRLNGYGMDAGKFWTPVMRQMLEERPKVNFSKPIDNIQEGKMIEIPDLTGDPDKDEQLLTSAGFLVTRVDISSSRPRGTYLGPSRRSGRAPSGTTIKLYFSSGKRRTVKSAPKTTEPAPRRTSETKTSEAPPPETKTSEPAPSTPKETVTEPKPAPVTPPKKNTPPKETNKPTPPPAPATP